MKPAGRRRAALELSLEIGSVLFVCGAALSSIVLWNQGVRAFAPYMIAASVPASASLGFGLLGLLFPSIVAVGRLAFPLYLTAPLMHSLGMVLVATLTHASFGLRVPPPQLLSALLWKDPTIVAIAFGGQVVLLAALAAMKVPGAAKTER